MASWQRPSCRTDEIENILSSVQRYDPANATVLEDYLGSQVTSDEYDPLSNLALLKLMQFNPELAQSNDNPDSPDTITLILVKALAHEPFGPDFSLCMALLSDRMSTLLSSQETLQAYEVATKLSNLLRQRAFNGFWTTLRSEEVYKSQLSPAIEALPSFSTLVRKGIARSVADTFKSLSRAKADEWLGFSQPEADKSEQLEDLVKALGWSVEGDLVKIPSNEANDPKSTVQSETVELSRLVRTLAQSVQV